MAGIFLLGVAPQSVLDSISSSYAGMNTPLRPETASTITPRLNPF